MAELFAANFVAAHQQVGDFKVVEVNGELVKNGGNVASYFCTPEGNVLHAVTGPASPETLLAAAQWSLDLAQELAGQSPRQWRPLAALAHYRELTGMLPSEEGPQWRNERSPWPGTTQPNSREGKLHQLFARRPLPHLEEVYEEIFERVLGQEVSEAAPRLDAAERGLMLAAETGKPVLFVLHDRRDNGDFYGEWRRSMGPHLGERSPLRDLLHSYVMIVLPVEDLPALSKFLNQPPFRAPSSSTPLFVIADSAGRQLDSAAGWGAQGELTHKLAAGLVESLRQRTPPVRELRRIVRFLQTVDRGLADEAIQLVPKAQEEAAQRLSARQPQAT